MREAAEKVLDTGNLTYIDNSILDAASWIPTECSYNSVLVEHPFGNAKPTFRRYPNRHFHEISGQIVKMLLRDLVVPELAGFTGTIWPITSQSKRWRISASRALAVGAACSLVCISIHAAT